jgi:hypothetical protein
LLLVQPLLWRSLAIRSGVDGLARADRSGRERLDILEYGEAIGCLRHDREMEPALWAGLREARLLLM